MSLGRAWRVARRERGPVLAVSCAVIPFGVLSLPCLVGLPITAYGLGKLAVVLLSAARDGEGAPRTPPRWPGVYALTGFAVLAGAMGLSAWIAVHLAAGQDPLVRLGAGFAAALAASVVTGAALAPFAFVPFVVADGAPGLIAPLTRSFELAGRLGPVRTLRLGATAGRWLGVSFLAVAAVFVATVPDAALSSALLAAPFAMIPGPPLAGALIADAYVEASATTERSASGGRASARLSALAVVLAPTVLLLAAAAIAAALTPTPMRPMGAHEPIRRGLQGGYLGASPRRSELPGGGATVRSTARGVVIEAPGGGGAGEVDARFDTTQCALLVLPGEAHGGAPGTYAVVVATDEQWALTVVDAGGVRQDDGLTRRTLGRLGRFGSAALALGMLLLLVLAYRIGVDLGEARALDVPDLREAGRGVLGALTGTLRLGEGARVRRARGLLEDAWIVEGDAWLEADAGALRFKLPEGRVRVLSGSDEPKDGGALVLLSRFERVAPAGLRHASTPWPDDARLVIGGRGEAEDALVRRATKVASWIALPAVAALGLAAAVLATSL